MSYYHDLFDPIKEAKRRLGVEKYRRLLAEYRKAWEGCAGDPLKQARVNQRFREMGLPAAALNRLRVAAK